MKYWLNVYDHSGITFVGFYPEFQSRHHADGYEPSINSIGLRVIYRIKVTIKQWEWLSPGGNICWFEAGFNPNDSEHGWIRLTKLG